MPQYSACISDSLYTCIPIPDDIVEAGGTPASVSFVVDCYDITSTELPNITVTEKIINEKTKTLYITNMGTEDVFIRAKIFYPLNSDITVENYNQWGIGTNDYYYYNEIVKPKENANILQVTIEGDIKEEEFTATDFYVIFEASPVLYDENGNPYADWNREW